MSGKRAKTAKVGSIVKIGRAGLKLHKVVAIVRPPIGMPGAKPPVAILGNGRAVKLSRLIAVKGKGRHK